MAIVYTDFAEYFGFSEASFLARKCADLGLTPSLYYVEEVATAGGRPVYNLRPTTDYVAPAVTVVGQKENLSYSYFNASYLKKWHAALAKVRTGTSDAKIALIGDSTTYGCGSNGQLFPGCRAKAYSTYLGPLLTSLGMTADDNSFFSDGNLKVSGNVQVTTGDTRITYSGPWASSTIDTLGGRAPFANGAGTLSFLPVTNCDTFDIYFLANTGLGTATVNVNGGGTLATLNGAITSTQSIQKTTVTAALAANTLNVVWASGAFYLLGIVGRLSTTPRVTLLNVGGASWKVGNLTLASATWNTLFALPYVAPDLSIIALNINDWNANTGAGTTMSSYMADMQSVITTAKTTGDVILMTAPSSNPLQAGNASTAVQQAFVRATYALAAANSAPLIDLNSRLIDYPTANGLGQMFDSVHCTSFGYADWAQAIASVLSRA